jgi:hypothetical protein
MNRPWLLTPYANSRTPEQRRYNTALIHTRWPVETSIGQLKRKFSVLHTELRVDIGRVPQIITSCAVLHNISKNMGNQLEYLGPEEAPDNYQMDVDDEQAIENVIYTRDDIAQNTRFF